MSINPTRSVSVKFSPIGRPQTFLLNDLLFADAPPVSGEKVVVQSEAGTAVGSVVPTPSMVMERRQPPEHSPNRVIRKATVEDVVVRLKRQQREQEAQAALERNVSPKVVSDWLMVNL